jgi:cytochrome c biogenesis protein CcmG, thiol:disulfide interchange protein DsbE
MTRKTKLLLGALGVVVLAVAAYFSNTANTATNNPGEAKQKKIDQTAELAEVGYRAPSFELTDFDGKTVKLSDLKGKPVVLNFWASWCGPCKAEMPDLESIHKQYGQHVQFYGINLTSQDDVASARKFAEATGITFPVLLDKEGMSQKNYRIVSVPTTYAIDADVRIVEIRKGAISKAAMDGMLQRLTQK